MKKLDKLTAALINGTSIVDTIRENSRVLTMEAGECPCGTPEWEEYVGRVYADGINAFRKDAI